MSIPNYGGQRKDGRQDCQHPHLGPFDGNPGVGMSTIRNDVKFSGTDCLLYLCCPRLSKKVALLQTRRDGHRYQEGMRLIEAPLPWQKAGLQETASGYGSRLRTVYKVQYNGRWRRVLARCWSNTSTLYLAGVDGTVEIRDRWES